jgi:hypothetical protein
MAGRSEKNLPAQSANPQIDEVHANRGGDVEVVGAKDDCVKLAKIHLSEGQPEESRTNQQADGKLQPARYPSAR